MRNEDFLFEEEDYYRELVYLQAEKDFEEWVFWKEDQKLEEKRKPAKIFVKKEEQITIEDDKATLDF